MTPAKNKTPEKLRPYIFHGIELIENGSEALGECPFCTKEKFSVNVETGRWQCFSCRTGTKKGGGGPHTFLQEFWKACFDATKDYLSFSTERKLLYPDTLIAWNVAKSFLTGDWLIPAYNEELKLQQLYSYRKTIKGMRLLPTPTLGHKLFGANLLNAHASTTFLCEGPWDAMAIYEVLKERRQSDGINLLENASILAVPGCNVFNEAWAPLFDGKIVNLCYDNDYPQAHPKTGKKIPPAGLSGMKRVASKLTENGKPLEINLLPWGKEKGLDHNPSFPDGFDIRDWLSS